MKPWKIRKFGEDIVWDLRNKGLLPVVALLVIAMVVIPVMISQQGKKSSGSSDATVAAGEVSAPEATSAVLAYNPGVRDYRKRLAALAEKDPFVQQFASTSSGETLTEVSTSVEGGGTVSETISVEGGGSGSGKGKTVVKTKFVSYRLDVAVGEAGALKIRRGVEQLDFLPSSEIPVVIFLGMDDGGTKAMFLVSSEVSAVSGEGTCMPGSSSPCEVLVLRRNQIEDFTYDPDGKTYRLKILDIAKVVKTTSGG